MRGASAEHRAYGVRYSVACVGMSDLSVLAAAMRVALRRARCDPTVPAELAVRNLRLAAAEIQRLCEGEVLDVVLLENDVLLQVYAFAAAAAKAVEPDHPARPAEPRDPVAQLENLRAGGLRQLHERRRQLLATLDEKYPPG